MADQPMARHHATSEDPPAVVRPATPDEPTILIALTNDASKIIINPAMLDEPTSVINLAAPNKPTAIMRPTTPVEPKDIVPLTNDKPKAIISTSVVSVLNWHLWAVVSISGTFALVYLNLTERFLGPELGLQGSSLDSANILGVLQLIVKAHELSIVASIVAIVEQYILRDLLGDGLLLGLLGASDAIANPSFLISTRFILALKFGLRSIYSGRSTPNGRDNPRTLRLVAMLFLSCVIAGLAGPSSAVLMIPRVDWFYNTHAYKSPFPRSTIPTVLLGTAPVLIRGTLAFMESNPFSLPDALIGSGMRYWSDIAWNQLHHPSLSQQEKSKHLFYDSYGLTLMNTSGSYYRPLDGRWTGGTKIYAEVKFGPELYHVVQFDYTYKDLAGNNGNVKLVDEAQVVNGLITCRARSKIPCTTDSEITEVSPYPDWCYRGVHSNFTSVGDMRMGRNLLMSQDFMDGQVYPRVWLTEGARIEQNQHYSESIDVLFEKHPDDQLSGMPNLTVCSFSASLIAATATSYGYENERSTFIYHDFVYSSQGTKLPPRKFLFHENWLDRAYGYDPTIWLTDSVPTAMGFNATLFTDGRWKGDFLWTIPSGSMVQPDNFTYPARPGLVPQKNTFGNFGRSLVDAVGFTNVERSGLEIEAAFLTEASVGGMLTYLLAWSHPSYSQYSMPYDRIPEKFRLGPPESFQHPHYMEASLKGYGYKLSNRTGRLGVAVLLTHAVLALAASLWQLLMRTGIVKAWSNVPDYVCLGSGSPRLVGTHPNTCAGIAGQAGLCSVVRVMATVSEDLTPHLEVIAVHYSGSVGAFAVDLKDDKKQYGFTEPKLKTQ